MTLTDDIARDLARRIAAQQQAAAGTEAAAPQRLTLAALAKEYGVSATPIRHALARLFDSGVVKRLPNGQLVPSKRSRAAGSSPSGSSARARRTAAAIPSQSPPAATAPSPSLTETVEREVLHKSLRGELGFLREEAFAERLAVGRTRLRGILHELAGKGVIEHVERCGFRARPFQQHDMLAFLEVRATLEVQALDLAKHQLDDRDLVAFLRGNDQDAIAANAIDNGLHDYFVKKANNHYLAAFFASHGRYYARLFDFATIDAGRLTEMAGQHTEILEHARARRFARARTALRHHIQSQAPVLSAAIAQLKSDH